ncbi:MAG: phosphatase PAP2 family protein [Bacteroidia bacterium]|nr:phosphatase PAP2 family protein [Bacteroidia bacterium]
MIEIFRNHKIYFIVSFTLVAMGLTLLIFLNKGEAVLLVDYYHLDFLDFIFNTITTFGEFTGFLISLIILIFITKKFKNKYVITLIMSALLSLGISQFSKHVLFSSEHRPSFYYDLTQVDGEEQHKNNSFPSGHTTAVFTFITVLAIGLKRSWIQLLMPFLGSLVAFSRIYLGQHFLMDVVVGAILGIFIATLSFYFVNKYWLT